MAGVIVTFVNKNNFCFIIDLDDIYRKKLWNAKFKKILKTADALILRALKGATAVNALLITEAITKYRVVSFLNPEKSHTTGQLKILLKTGARSKLV